MIKKIILTAAAGAVIAASAANAEGAYVGAEASFNRPSYKTSTSGDLALTTRNNKSVLKKTKAGMGALVGYKFTDMFAAEAGYSYITKVTGNNGATNVTNKVNNIHLDGLGFIPATKDIDLIGSVGAGRMKSKVTGPAFTNVTALNKAKIGFRLGGGAQYKIDNNLAARLMVRYQKGNSSFLKNNTSAALGLTYSF